MAVLGMLMALKGWLGSNLEGYGIGLLTALGLDAALAWEQRQKTRPTKKGWR